MKARGHFKGWIEGKSFGFIKQDGSGPDIFIHSSALSQSQSLQRADKIEVEYEVSFRGLIASSVIHIESDFQAGGIDTSSSENEATDYLQDDYVEIEFDTVNRDALREISTWKREAKSEDNERYFWHVGEVAELKAGERCFVIGRKGAGKTALCEYFNRSDLPNTYSEKLSFKNFPFNELYGRPNKQFTQPN